VEMGFRGGESSRYLPVELSIAISCAVPQLPDPHLPGGGSIGQISGESCCIGVILHELHIAHCAFISVGQARALSPQALPEPHLFIAGFGSARYVPYRSDPRP
jgi:hypothetical protein